MKSDSVSRRGFLAKSAGAAAAFQIIRPELVRGFADEKMKAGLIGCGGRGTQAVENILTGAPNVEITALADLPSREVLLTQIAGLFQQPLTRAAGLSRRSRATSPTA